MLMWTYFVKWLIPVCHSLLPPVKSCNHYLRPKEYMYELSRCDSEMASFLTPFNFEPPAFENAARYPNSETMDLFCKMANHCVYSQM